MASVMANIIKSMENGRPVAEPSNGVGGGGIVVGDVNSDDKYTITLCNKRICEFYDENPHLNIETMNILFIEILEKMFQGVSPALDSKTLTQMFDGVKTIQSQIGIINERIMTLQTDQSNSFALQFSNFKREYLDDLKMILIADSKNAQDKIEQIVEKNGNILQDKTRIFLGDIIPKNQEHIKKEIQQMIAELQRKINIDTNALTSSQISKDILDAFITSVDGKFSKTLVDTQVVLNSLFSATEQRIQTKMDDTETKVSEIRNMATTNNTISVALQGHLTELLKKMENSSTKGKISENILYGLLLGSYPMADVEYVGNTKEMGDIMMARKEKPIILFENKNYEKNVSQDEINKFYRDCETQNVSGILLSQKSGIVNKNNFEIEIRNHNILIFLHNAEYNMDKIKVCVDIIDYLCDILSSIENENKDDFIIEKGVMNDINKEFRDFTTVKLNHLKTIKEFHVRLMSEAEDLKFPNLENYLSKKYEVSLSTKDMCKYCQFHAKNLRALSAHMRGCKLNPINLSNLTTANKGYIHPATPKEMIEPATNMTISGGGAKRDDEHTTTANAI